MKKLLLCLILTSSMNVFSKLSQEDEALFRAVNSRDSKAVKAALANGADVNAVGPTYRQTPLHDAATNGYTDIVRVLVENNANIDALDNCGHPPLYWAINCEMRDTHIETMQLLLDHGANIENAKGDIDTAWGKGIVDTVLGKAASYNQPAAVILLLAYGADVNAKDKYENTPLHEAAKMAKFGRIAVAHLLLANGADVNAKNKFGELVMCSAIKGSAYGASSVEMVELLLNYGADVNAIVSDEEKETSLILAAKQRDEAIVKLLLARGANRKATDINGETAADWAAYMFDPKIMSLL